MQAEDDDSDDDAADGDLSAISAGFMAPCKLVTASVLIYHGLNTHAY